MQINEKKYGFTLIRSRYIEDINGTLYEFEHEKSGGHVAYIENGDTNCVMAIGFRTLPEDSTGVCHIIEHSVLCGSKKYPLKEPFVNLLKNSLSTFLNAFTAYDWTMYPCASQTPKDFDNIMDVYLDAVFNPRSVVDPHPFLQEGWHLELLKEEDVPCYKGVVYNEMKGAMSTPVSVLEQTTLEAMYPDTAYRFNSGGEPADIPNLTYEAYVSFYKRHYNPQNAMMLLYGKMDIEAKLEYIDREYYSHYEKGEEIVIPAQAPIINHDLVKEYEIGPEDEEKDNTYLALAFGLAPYQDNETLVAFRILEDALLSENASPLKKALLARGLGQDVNSRIDDDNIVPALHILLEKTNKKQKEAFRLAFLEEVKKLVDEGIDKNLLLASINNFEFKDKEGDMGGFPKGIVYAMTMMGSFNYRGDLASNLQSLHLYDKYRARLGERYFEGLLEKYILNSVHNVEVMIVPSKTLGAKKKAEMDAKMKAIKGSLSKEEVSALVAQTKDLLAFQAHVDTPKELRCLPELKLSEIPMSVNSIGTKKTKIKGVRTLLHEGESRGIVYVNGLFSLEALSLEDYRYAVLLGSVLAYVPTRKHSLLELSNEVKMHLGDLGFSTKIISYKRNSGAPYFAFTASALKENAPKMVELLNEIISSSVFDAKIVKQQVIQMVNGLRNRLIGNGMAVAMDECARAHDSGAAYSSTIESYLWLKDLRDHFDIRALRAKFKELLPLIFRKENALISITGDAASIEAGKAALAGLKLKRIRCEKKMASPSIPVSKRALIIPSDISYNAIGFNMEDYGFAYSGSCSLVSHILRYGYLWDEIRVKGGAYGASISLSPTGLALLGSYRDPNVTLTYENFAKIGEALRNFSPTKREFKNYIIGALGNFDKPASVRALGSTADILFINGITKKDRIQRKKELIRTKVEDVRAFAALFELSQGKQSCFTVGNKAKIEEATFDSVEVLS